MHFDEWLSIDRCLAERLARSYGVERDFMFALRAALFTFAGLA